MNPIIVAECKPDITLISILRINIDTRHTHGKSRVIKILTKSHEPAIGLVDEDPNRPLPRSFRTNFVLVYEFKSSDLKVFKHNKKDSYLVMLSPRLEEWILNACKEANISPWHYNLPDDPDKLHGIININIRGLVNLLDHLLLIESNRLQHLKKIFHDLLSKLRNG